MDNTAKAVFNLLQIARSAGTKLELTLNEIKIGDVALDITTLPLEEALQDAPTRLAELAMRKTFNN